MRLLLLVVLLAGCSSSAPSTYQRGTFVAPPPAPARPGVGLPAYGDPGAQGKQYPRSSHDRVLPPMREPTIFSSDSPRSSSEGPPNWRNRWPKVLDVDLLTDWPLDEDMSEDDKQAFLLYVENVRACAAIQDMALTLLHGENAFSKWQPSERRCLVATLHRICASKDRARFEWALKTATDEQRARVEYARKAYEQNVNVAQRFVDESCRPRSAYSQRVMDVFNSVALRWETFDWRWPTPK